jgi:hypothetical protein
MMVPVLRSSAAAVVAVVVISVSVVVVASLASAVPLSGGHNGGAMGTPVVLPAPMTMVMAAAARGGRVEDLAAAEMGSEAHRRVVLAALPGAASLPYVSVLDAGRAACDPHCPGKSGDPYNRHCLKIYHCSQ